MKENLYNYLTQELGLNSENVDYNNAPQEVTYEMLEKEMNTSLDFKAMIKQKDYVKNVNLLWRPYTVLFFPKNKLGIYFDKNKIDKINFGISMKTDLDDKKNKVIPQINNKTNKTNDPFLASLIKKINKDNNSIGGAKKTKYYKKKIYKNKTKKIYKKKSTEKIYKKYRQRGGTILPAGTPLMLENYTMYDAQLLVQYNKYPNINMWGMQIPNNNDRLLLLQQYAHIMYTLEIKTVIDVHSCGTGLHPRPGVGWEQCNETGDIDCERETWEFLKKLNINNINDPTIQFYNDRDGIGIADMTCGTITAWFNLIDLPVDLNFTNTDKFVIHCQAGFGRTGSIMLLYVLKYMLNSSLTNGYANHLLMPFFGFPNSTEFYTYLRSYFDKPELINQYEEVFKISNTFSQLLFVQRINYILLALYKHFNLWGTPVYFYNINPIRAGILPPFEENIFIPILTVINNVGLVDAANLRYNNLII